MASYIVLRSFAPYTAGSVITLTDAQYASLSSAHPNSLGPTGTTTSSGSSTGTTTTTTGTSTSTSSLVLTAGPGITIVTNSDGSKTITDTAAAAGPVLIGD